MLADLATKVMTEVHHLMPMVASAGTSTDPVAFDGLTTEEIQTATSSIFDVVTAILNEIV